MGRRRRSVRPRHCVRGRRGRFTLGEGSGCDAVVPSGALGALVADVVTWDRGPCLTPPRDARLTLDGHALPAAPTALRAGETARVSFGDFYSARAAPVAREAWTRPAGVDVGISPLVGFGLSAFAHAAVLLVLALYLSPLAGAVDAEITRDEVLTMRRMLDASAERELAWRRVISPRGSARSVARPRVGPSPLTAPPLRPPLVRGIARARSGAGSAPQRRSLSDARRRVLGAGRERRNGRSRTRPGDRPRRAQRLSRGCPRQLRRQRRPDRRSLRRPSDRQARSSTASALSGVGLGLGGKFGNDRQEAQDVAALTASLEGLASRRRIPAASVVAARGAPGMSPESARPAFGSAGAATSPSMAASTRGRSTASSRSTGVAFSAATVPGSGRTPAPRPHGGELRDRRAP